MGCFSSKAAAAAAPSENNKEAVKTEKEEGVKSGESTRENEEGAKSEEESGENVEYSDALPTEYDYDMKSWRAKQAAYEEASFWEKLEPHRIFWSP